MPLQRLQNLSQIASASWDALVPESQPFLRHAFLSALEDSGSVGPHTGWQPEHLLHIEDDRLIAALPSYRKWHSYGEYVFDHAWADACERAGIAYHVVNVDAGDARQADLHLKGKVSDGTELPPYNTNLFCLPAFDTASRVFMQKGPVVFEGYRNIGWWPWELNVFPKAWQPHAASKLQHSPAAAMTRTRAANTQAGCSSRER